MGLNSDKTAKGFFCINSTNAASISSTLWFKKKRANFGGL